jgi:phage host-nuclease inhibitor protein Gam
MARKRNAGSVALRLSLEDGETVRQALKNIGQDGERALRAIERAAPDASQGLSVLDDATRAVSDRMEGMAGSAGGVGRVLSAAGPFGLGAAAAVGIAVSLAAATLNAAREISDLRREAERAGQSFEGFQELAVIANRTGIQVEALADGMRELQLRADEFVQTDGGAAKEAFERLGFDRASVQTALQDVDGFFDDVLGRIGELDRAAQIRVLDELFGGTAGEQFTRLLDEGVENLEAMRQAARDTGQVLSEEVGEEAEELRRKYDEAANILKTQMHEALANLMPLLTELIEAAGNFLGLINDIVGALRSAPAQMSIDDLRSQIAAAEIELEGATNNRDRRNLRQRLATYREELAMREQIAAEAEARGSGDAVGGGGGDLPILPSTRTGAERERERLERLAEAYRRDLAGAIGVYERAVAEVGMLVDANLLSMEEGLQIELGLRRELEGQLEKERDARLRAATDPVSGAVRALRDIEREAFDMASSVEDATTSVFGGIEDTFVSIATTGKASFRDLTDSIIADLARIATRQLITGPLSQALGSVLGGGGSIGMPTNLLPFVDGGIMTPQGALPLHTYRTGGVANTPQLAMFGEGDMAEAYVPLPDGRSIPVTMTGQPGATGQSAIRIELGPGLEGRVLTRARGHAIEIVEAYDEERQRADRLL